MKSLWLMVAALLFTTAVHAQTPNVSVLNTKLAVAADYAADTRSSRTAARVTSNPVSSDTQQALEMMGDTADQRVGTRYTLSIEVKNDESKAIRALTFEYLLRVARGRKSAEKITFKSKKEIKPGQTITLSHNFTTREYVFPFGDAIIKRIDYADGSVWRR